MFRQGVDDKPTGTPPMIGKRLTIDEWLDYVAAYQFTGVAADRVVLHHTVSPNAVTWNGLRSMTGMQTYYRGKGWTSAPHIYTGPDGIWLFSPLNEIGIHAGTGNSGYWHGRLAWYSIGLEMVGLFDRDRPQGTVWENSLAVLGGLCRKFGKTPEQAISFHRDYTDEKSCPGWAVEKPWVFEQVNAWLASTNLGLAVAAAPRISEAKFRKVLETTMSPAQPVAGELYAICGRMGIDPAVALAFFAHESTYGRAGICKDYDTKNWGNVRSLEDPSLGRVIATRGGNFARYPSWEAGLLDWCKRIKGPKYAGCGLTTVETILPKYAPSSDSNSPAKYAQAVRDLVAGWQKDEQPKGWYVTVTATPHLRVRQGAKSSYPIAGVRATGEHVLVDGSKDEGEGEWLHLASGLGFIKAEFTRA